jgi:glycine cleavage system H protein
LQAMGYRFQSPVTAIACQQAPPSIRTPHPLAATAMSNIPSDLRYAKSHEWLKVGADGTATVGITDYAQNSLGDITYVQLPKVGATLKAGETFGVVESVKAASDLYAPAGGTVTAVNTALESAPETVNRAPYADGWMLKLKLADPGATGTLVDAAGYEKLIA